MRNVRNGERAGLDGLLLYLSGVTGDSLRLLILGKARIRLPRIGSAAKEGWGMAEDGRREEAADHILQTMESEIRRAVMEAEGIRNTPYFSFEHIRGEVLKRLPGSAA